ncbi:MAG: gliding motility-associated ABC transporter permease subunit GldF [Paludibacteraceae bacterium]|jgi:ABC-2 type transport system permease protein|nr:gliding motility-associated ABC transporter permease subunit GldF [Paludibacteraceae bacterium]
MFILFKKELQAFFSSLAGYIVIGIFLIITSLFLWVFPTNYNIIENGYAQADGLFALAPWLYLFLVPAVTMRLFAEEKRTGTMELLYTQPLTALDIVLGKYFAGVALVLISLFPTIIYYLSICFLAEPIGNVDHGAFWGSFIGLAMLALVYTSVGLFASAITNNQIVAFLIAVIGCFALFLGFDLVGSTFNSGLIESIISWFGINYHYESMSRGVLDSRDVIYFFSVTTIFILFCTKIIKR